jgi:hypothetical protein
MKNPTPVQTLVRLFILAVAVEPGEADTAFAPHGWRRFADLGLLREGADGIEATVGLAHHAGLWLTHDRLERATLEGASDYVLGLNAPARLLAGLTPRGRVEWTLDLGTGCGVQAFLAAGHSQGVVATDLSSRALDFARFNARLNRVANVEFRQGDLFEPAGDRRFDLIVSNPPYVVSPDATFVFRDGGLPLDTLCRRVAEGMAVHLGTGGLGIMLANWVHRHGVGDEPWDAPPRAWLAGRGCDAWILRSETHDPLTYAAAWNRSAAPDAYDESVARWTAYYDREGLRAITLGALLLRRRAAGPGWVQSEESELHSTENYEGQVTRCFEAGAFLEAHPDDRSLLAAVLRRSDDHEIVQVLRPGRGGYESAGVELRQFRGFRFRGQVDATAVRMLSLFDGQRTLADIAKELAASTGLAAEACAGIAAALVRRMIVLGFLVPAKGSGTGSVLSPRGDAGAGVGS